MNKSITLCLFFSLNIFSGNFPVPVGPSLTEEDQTHLTEPFKHISEFVELDAKAPSQQALIKESMAPFSMAEVLLKQIITCYKILYEGQSIKNELFGVPDSQGTPTCLLDYAIPATLLYEEGSNFIYNHTLHTGDTFNTPRKVYEKTLNIEGKEISLQKSFKVFQKIMNVFFSNLKRSGIPINHPYGVLDIEFPGAPNTLLGYFWDEHGIVPITIEKRSLNFTSLNYSELCGLKVLANNSQIIPEPHVYLYKSMLAKGCVRVEFTSNLTQTPHTPLKKKIYNSLPPLSLPKDNAPFPDEMRITPESQYFLQSILGKQLHTTFPLPQTEGEEELFLLSLLEESLEEDDGFIQQEYVQALTHSLASPTFESVKAQTTKVLSTEAQKDLLRKKIQKQRELIAQRIVDNASPKEDQQKKAQASQKKKQRAQKAKKKKRLAEKYKTPSRPNSVATSAKKNPQTQHSAISDILSDFEKKRVKFRHLSKIVKAVCRDNVELKRSLIERFSQIHQSGSHRSIKGATLVAPHGTSDRTLPGRYFTDFIRQALEGTEACSQTSSGVGAQLKDSAF